MQELILVLSCEILNLPLNAYNLPTLYIMPYPDNDEKPDIGKN